jgi:Protein of unknown function DUF262
MEIQPQHLTLTRLLANRLFRIPRYQRAYSWESKHRKDMFDDIWQLKQEGPDAWHFMATVVGLRRESKTIVTDQYWVVDVVDGQQRLTTLVILLKAIEKKLDAQSEAERTLSIELRELLVKQDNLSLVLLQTNHDRSEYFVNYLRKGTRPKATEARTIGDRELLNSFVECEDFVDRWDDRIELLRIIKNQLTFIFHELADEAVVYTVFEVLNNRGLRVPWLDRLKSMLMATAFHHSSGNAEEHLNELHQLWGKVYECIGLRQGLNTEGLRVAATLRARVCPSKPLSEESAVENIVADCGDNPVRAIEYSAWLCEVTAAVDRFLGERQRSQAVVSKIAQARLLALAIILRRRTKVRTVPSRAQTCKPCTLNRSQGMTPSTAL